MKKWTGTLGTRASKKKKIKEERKMLLSSFFEALVPSAVDWEKRGHSTHSKSIRDFFRAKGFFADFLMDFPWKQEFGEGVREFLGVKYPSEKHFINCFLYGKCAPLRGDDLLFHRKFIYGEQAALSLPHFQRLFYCVPGKSLKSHRHSEHRLFLRVIRLCLCLV